MISNAIGSGVASIQGGMARLDRSAQEIAHQSISTVTPDEQQTGAGTSPSVSQARDLTDPLIEQHQALYQVQAGAKVITTMNKALGSLFDAFA